MHTYFYHHTLCGHMEQNSSVKQLNEFQRSNWNLYSRFAGRCSLFILFPYIWYSTPIITPQTKDGEKKSCFSLFHILAFQALDTLGNTKWRVNKRVLGILDRIWASGGRLADLVDREDVGDDAT